MVNKVTIHKHELRFLLFGRIDILDEKNVFTDESISDCSGRQRDAQNEEKTFVDKNSSEKKNLLTGNYFNNIHLFLFLSLPPNGTYYFTTINYIFRYKLLQLLQISLKLPSLCCER